MITANASTAADDLGVAVSGNAAIEGVLENDARVVAAKSGKGDNHVCPACKEHRGGINYIVVCSCLGALLKSVAAGLCISSTSPWQASLPPGIQNVTMMMTIRTPAVGRMGWIKKMASALLAVMRASATICHCRWKQRLTQ
jgi:hypothetical protein